MNNIVERLKNCSSHSGISYCIACKYEKDECCEERLMTEAADEIERLNKCGENLYNEYLELKEELEAERKKYEKLAKENKELRDERDVDHYANIALYSALEEERKKHD